MTATEVSRLSLVHDSTDNDGFVQSWQLALQADGKHRPLTILTYTKALRTFSHWLDSSGRSSDLLAVSKRDCVAWFAQQTADAMSSNTRRSRWIALRSFYGWLASEDEIDVNPMAAVEVARPTNEDTRILTEDEITRLLAACDGKGFDQRRDRAMMLFMLTTGVRKFEACNVTLADVDMATRIVAVPDGKGGKSRVVVPSAPATAALDKYLRVRSRHPDASSPYLWLGRQGRFTVHGVDQMVRRRGVQAGIEGMRSHVLRHTWADGEKRDGRSDGDLMVLGGWSTHENLRRYGAVAATSRAVAAAKASNAFSNVR